MYHKNKNKTRKKPNQTEKTVDCILCWSAPPEHEACAGVADNSVTVHWRKLIFLSRQV